MSILLRTLIFIRHVNFYCTRQFLFKDVLIKINRQMALELDYQDMLTQISKPSPISNHELFSTADVKELEKRLNDDGIRLQLKENFDKEGYFEPKDGEYAPKGSLWNNPMINKARDKMTPEQLEYFEKQGESMYNYDFANADVDADIKEGVEYAIMCLKSGLHPRDLTELELNQLEDLHGPSWFLSFGFTEEDVYGED